MAGALPQPTSLGTAGTRTNPVRRDGYGGEHTERGRCTMARVSTYLNFPGTTEKAFDFYRKVFQTELDGPISRMGDAPPTPGQPPLAEKDEKLVMHVALPILAGHVIMGTDVPESMGFELKQGNAVSINLEPDTRAETKRLFDELCQGGQVEMPLQDMFWGALFGSLVDRFGVRWMFNCTSEA
jgi:PhnB protein